MMKLFSLAIVAMIVLSGLAFAGTSNCADGTSNGTKYFACSKAAGYVGQRCGPNGFFRDYVGCICEEYGYVTQGEGDTSTCVQATCDDGTKNGECAKIQPKVCIGGSAYGDNAAKCGCPAFKKKAADGILCVPIPCNYSGESIAWGICSVKGGKLCQNGTLVDAASKCPCKSGMANVNEKCVATCIDGTVESACSKTLPKKCTGGDLVDDAASCGCPQGQSAVGKNCAESVLGGVLGGVDLLGGGNSNPNQSNGSDVSGGAGPLSCCCLPTALIGIVGGFAFFRKEG